MKAILFDLYETLITEFDPEWEPGISLGDCLGVDRQAFATAWKATFVRRMSGEIPDLISVLHEIGKMLDCTFDDALVQQLCQKRIAEHRSLLLQVSEDILHMLRCLRQAGIRLGVVSNVSPEEVTAWEESPLRPFFDATLFSFQVGLVKPDRRIYELACARLGVAPENTLYVGDGGSDELFGAETAGLTPCWATWFLSRWPEWETSPKRERNAGHFVRLDRPEQLIALAVGERNPVPSIAFTPFAQHEPGIVVSLLLRCYAAYLAIDPQAAQAWPADWAAYDHDIFPFPDTVGACGFVTCLDGEPIGFASWDPRAFPDYGVIGHNCILPAFRGNGYGTAQVRRMRETLQARGFKRARVTTGDHPFFIPAQRMYETCGFQEIGRGLCDPRASLGMVDYELLLQEAKAGATPGLEPAKKDLDQTLALFLKLLGDFFDKRLVSVLLYGSVVFDDLAPGYGDLDFLVVVDRDLTEPECQELVKLRQPLHDGTYGVLAAMLEGAFLSRRMLDSSHPGMALWWGTSGERIWEANHLGWLALHAIRERGMVVWGEDIRPEIPVVSRKALIDDVRAACRALRQHGRGGSLHSVDWLLMAARLLLWLQEGRLCSKSDAAEWGYHHARGEWHHLLPQARQIRLNPALASSAQVRAWLDALVGPIQEAGDEVEQELARQSG